MPLQDLPQSAQALRVAIDAMPVGVSWANLSDRKILFMNRKFTEIFGYIVTDFADIAGWVEQTYPFAEDRAQVANTWGAFLEAQKTPLLAEAPFEIPPIEIRIRCKDGAIKTVRSGRSSMTNARKRALLRELPFWLCNVLAIAGIPSRMVVWAASFRLSASLIKRSSGVCDSGSGAAGRLERYVL